ncbi:MAG TPA: PHB depolymerase family esterase [Rubrobacteraceae bacterium]|nr:PHB depolymerase family esterase [Rubrobacteraceae bacterium]
MSNPIQDGMAEATRLTREGKLAEATALIQRALGGGFTGGSTGATDTSSNFGDPLQAILHAINEDPRSATASQQDQDTQTLRPAPRHARPHRTSRGMPRSPGTLTVEPLGTPTEPGRFIERSYTNRFGTRAYKLYIPTGYVGQAVPLVVMLHGCTQNPNDFASGTGMNTLAEEHTFLVAYPAQSGNANMQKCWNWFQAADQQRGQGEPSLIAGITCEVVGEYHVAADRVYVAGMSAGGAMAAVMGATYPDVYAAVGVHSGLAPGAAHDMSSAFTAMRNGMHAGKAGAMAPTIVFHGDRDTTVHPRNAEHLISHGLKGTPGAQAAQSQGQSPGGRSYTRVSYEDAEGRTVVEQWTVHGLGHAWSGGDSRGSYTDPTGPDASAEMMRFFEQHSLQGAGDASDG